MRNEHIHVHKKWILRKYILALELACGAVSLMVFFFLFSFLCDYLWSQNKNNNKQQTKISSIFIQLFQQFYKIHGTYSYNRDG